MWLQSLANLVRQIIFLPFAVIRAVARIAWKIAVVLFDFIVSVARPALRFMAFVFLLIATVALVADLTPAFNGADAYRSTMFAEHWNGIAPRSLEAARASVMAAPQAWITSYFFEALLALPTSLLFGALGGIAAYAGRRQKRLNIYVN